MNKNTAFKMIIQMSKVLTSYDVTHTLRPVHYWSPGKNVYTTNGLYQNGTHVFQCGLYKLPLPIASATICILTC